MTTLLSKINQLSIREREVLSFVTRGMTAKMIAKELIISPRTVEQHIENIKRKIGIGSKYQLIWSHFG